MKDIAYIVAGAGSGKTYALTHNLLDRFRNRDIKPSEVIVTTFTRAAANDIRQRAREVLLKNGHTELVSQLDAAAIGTVHSVARQFLDRFWYLTGSVPGRSVISDDDKRLYRNRSLSVMLERGGFDAEKRAIDRYVSVFCPRHSEGGFPVPYPEFWTEYLEHITGKMEYYEIKDLEYSLEQSKDLTDRLFSSPQEPSDSQFQAIAAAIVHDAEAKVAAGGRVETLKKSLKKYRKFKRTVNYPDLLEMYDVCSSAPDWLANAGSYTETLAGWMRSTWFGSIINECTQALFKLASAWQTEYAAYKKSNGLIDYDDMERGFLELLDQPEVQDYVSRNFKLVMVDEFQDSNPVQLRIFDKLSELVSRQSTLHPSSFWVGDPKQSIYGFRGSDSDLIRRVSDQFPNEMTELDKDNILPDRASGGLLRAGLDKSYRSCKDLVETSNRVFKPMFPDMVCLKPHRDDTLSDQVCHWHFMDKNQDARRSLARQIGNLKVPFGDIAVLVRNNSQLNSTVSAFRQEGIPVTCVEHDFLDRAEVQLLLSLLWLSQYQVDGKGNIRCKLHELASVMHLWNDVSTEDILECRIDYLNNERSKTKYDEWLKDEQSLEVIRRAVSHAVCKPLDQRLAIFIHELDLNDKVRKWGDRDVRRQNLKTMQKLAAQYESNCESLGQKADITGYVSYLESANVRPVPDMESDTVKVCTYHGSKGLEWQWVFLLSLDDTDMDSGFVMHECWGVHELRKPGQDGTLYPEYYLSVMPAPYWGKSCAVIEELSELTDSPLYTSSRERVQNEMKRLLYVGFTRAKDHAVLVTCDKSEPKWLTDICLEADDFKAAYREFPSINPKQPTEPPVPAPRAQKKTIEAYPAKLAEYKRDLEAYEKAQSENAAIEARLNTPEPYSCRNLPLTLIGPEKKYLNPSRMGAGKGGHTFTMEQIRERICLATADYIPTVLGTCIHNAFAVCPDVVGPDYPSQVSRIIANYGLSHILDKPEQLAAAIADLYSWLTDKYGPATEILHEYPFEYPVADGQVMRGDMDLVWCTAGGCVIVDFKNYCGQDNVTDPKSPHYVGHHYEAQLHAYRSILEKAGYTVAGTILYYDLLGQVVKVEQ